MNVIPTQNTAGDTISVFGSVGAMSEAGMGQDQNLLSVQSLPMRSSTTRTIKMMPMTPMPP